MKGSTQQPTDVTIFKAPDGSRWELMPSSLPQGVKEIRNPSDIAIEIDHHLGAFRLYIKAVDELYFQRTAGTNAVYFRAKMVAPPRKKMEMLHLTALHEDQLYYNRGR